MNVDLIRLKVINRAFNEVITELTHNTILAALDTTAHAKSIKVKMPSSDTLMLMKVYDKAKGCY